MNCPDCLSQAIRDLLSNTYGCFLSDEAVRKIEEVADFVADPDYDAEDDEVAVSGRCCADGAADPSPS